MDAQAEPGLRARLGALVGHRGVKFGLALALVAIAIFVLHGLAAEVSWRDVKADAAALPPWRLVAALGFTAMSFAALACYDVLAVASVAPGRVPAHLAAVAGASGYAVSNLLGFSWLTGGAMRFRIYTALKLDWSLVAGVIATSWISFWLGVVLLIGVLLAVHPTGAAALLNLSPLLERAAGLGLVAAMAGVFVWLGRRPRRLAIAEFRLALPGARLALAQTGVAILDVLGASLALYVLLPPDAVPSFAAFFLVYALAIGLGVLSHAPGGVGVFEATLIAGLDLGGRSDVLAALLMFRLIYYVLPFAVTVGAMAVLFLRARRHDASALTRALAPIVRAVVPPMAAGMALISGALLLVSGDLPMEAARLAVLRALLPLPFVEVSHLAGSIVGVLLIVVARGLYRKQRRAWVAAMILVGLGFVASLSTGLDWEEAVSLAVAAALLVLFRSAFYRTAAQPLFRLNRQWMLGSAALIAIAIWIGFFAYSDTAWRNELWWQVAWRGDAPRFLRASLAAAVVFGAISLNSLLSHRGGRLPPEPIPEQVRALVSASPVSEAGIALTGDKRFLLDPEGRAFLAYADSGGSLISKGDPIGDVQAGEALIWGLREMADRTGRRAAFYAVTQTHLPVFLDMGLTILKIGEVARVPLPRFTLDGPGKKDFRYAHRRAEREGLRFEIVRAADLRPLLPALRAVSDGWLRSKRGEEKAFALGAFDESYLRNFDHAVLRGPGAEVLAFANLLQGAERVELAIDLMRYAADAPNYAMDALFAHLMLWGKAEGFAWFSLGAAPFAGLKDHPLASLWSRLGSYAYRHGEHFYNFEGLRAFKQKFEPVWLPSYLASPPRLGAPRVLYEVNVLISGGVAGLVK